MSLTSLWVTLQKKQTPILQTLIGILLFAAGWQTGLVMSPYYASHQIVFTDKLCNGCASSGGTSAELDELSAASKQPVAKLTVVSAQTQALAVNTSQPKTTSETSPDAATTGDKVYVASVHSNLFHHRDCPSSKRIKAENQVWFATPEQAQAAGYSPSVCTKQKLGQST